MPWDGGGREGETGTPLSFVFLSRISPRKYAKHTKYIHIQSTMFPRRNWDSPTLSQLLQTVPLIDNFLFLDPLTAVPLKVALFIFFLVCSALS